MSRWGFHEMAKFEITTLHFKRSNRQMISIEVPEMRWLGSRSSLNISPPARQMISTPMRQQPLHLIPASS